MRGGILLVVVGILASGCLARPLATPEPEARAPDTPPPVSPPDPATAPRAGSPAPPIIPRGSSPGGMEDTASSAATTAQASAPAEGSRAPSGSTVQGGVSAPAPTTGSPPPAPPPAPASSGDSGSGDGEGADVPTSQVKSGGSGGSAAPPPAPTVAWVGEHDYGGDPTHGPDTYAFQVDDARFTRVKLDVAFDPGARAVLVQSHVSVTLVEPNGADSIGCSLALPIAGSESCAKATNAKPGVWGIRFDGFGSAVARAKVTFSADGSD